METVNLSFCYAEQDYVRAMRAHYATRLRLPLNIAITTAAAIVGLYELRSGSRAFGITLLCLAVVFALILVAAFMVIPRISFRSQPKLRDEYALRFSPEGIHFQTAHIDSNLQWAMYTKALVDPYSFILYYGTQQFTAFQSGSFRTSRSDRRSSDCCTKMYRTWWTRRSRRILRTLVGEKSPYHSLSPEGYRCNRLLSPLSEVAGDSWRNVQAS